MFKALPVVGLDFMAKTQLVAEHDVVRSRRQVDLDLALRAGDFGADVVSVRLCSGGEVVPDLSAVVLYHADAVVHVVRLCKLRVVLQRADGIAALGLGVVQKPQRQVDVVDGAVDKNAAVAFRIRRKETGFVQQVSRLAADHVRVSDGPGFDLVVCVSVRCVEPPGEPGHHF